MVTASGHRLVNRFDFYLLILECESTKIVHKWSNIVSVQMHPGFCGHSHGCRGTGQEEVDVGCFDNHYNY